MMSRDSLLSRVQHKVYMLQDERIEVTSAISNHLGPVLTNGRNLLLEPDASEERLQEAALAMDMCIQSCRDFRRNLHHQPLRIVRQRANDPHFNDMDSSTEPPPSYQEVLLAQKQTNVCGHNGIVDMTNSAMAAARDNTRRRPTWDINRYLLSTRRNDAVSRYSQYSLKVHFEPVRPLPQGSYLTSEEKARRPISTYFGRWDFLKEGGWIYKEGFSCFVPPISTRYLVRIEWTQMGEGKLLIALGTVNDPSSVDLYEKADEALTKEPDERGKLEKFIDLQGRLGLWTSIFREKDNPHVKDFLLSARVCEVDCYGSPL